MHDLQRLTRVIQRNCDVSDAMFAGAYSMCTYLLKMREYFRWEKGYGLTERLPRRDVGSWLEERERLWETMETDDFQCVPLAQDCHDPFDSRLINRCLVPEGLVYSGGYGQFGKPHFFLGLLLYTEHHEGLTVYVSASEYARDLTAPPAMFQGDSVFIRRESLRRAIWEMVDDWQWKKRPGALARTMAHYRFEHDSVEAIERLTDQEVGTIILHEIGEAIGERMLGEAWRRLVFTVSGSKEEFVLRAVRDHLADSVSTLPALLETADVPRLHFYFANLRGLRRELFPSAVTAYERWVDEGNIEPLRELIALAPAHWQCAAETLVREWEDGSEHRPEERLAALEERLRL